MKRLLEHERSVHIGPGGELDPDRRRFERYRDLCWHRHIAASTNLVSNRHFTQPPNQMGDPHYGDTLLWQGIALASYALDYEHGGSAGSYDRMHAILHALLRLEVDYAGQPAHGLSGYLIRTDQGPEAPPNPASQPSGSNYTGAMLGMTLAHRVLTQARPDPQLASSIAGLMQRIGQHFARFGYFGYMPGSYVTPGDRTRKYKRDDQLRCKNKDYEPAKGVVSRGAYATVTFEHAFRQMIREVSGQDFPSVEANLFKRIRYKEGREYWDPLTLAPIPIHPLCPSSKYVRQQYIVGLRNWAESLPLRLLAKVPAILAVAFDSGTAAAFVDAVGRGDPSLLLSLLLVPEQLLARKLGELAFLAPDVLIFEGLRMRLADDFQRPDGDTAAISSIVVGQCIKAALPDARRRFELLIRIKRLALQHMPGYMLPGKYDDLHVMFMACMYGVSDQQLLHEFVALYEAVKQIPGDRNPAMALIAELIARRLGVEHAPWVRDAWAEASLAQLSSFPARHLPNTWYTPAPGQPAYRQDYAWQRAPSARAEPFCAGHDHSCNVEMPGLDYLFPYALQRHLRPEHHDDAGYRPPSSCPSTIEGAPGERRRVSLEFVNTGTSTWHPASHKLGAVGDQDGDAHLFLAGAGGDPNRVWLTQPVEPQASHRFEFELVAPGEGSYEPRFQMVHEGVGWFGDMTPRVRVEVRQGWVGEDDAVVWWAPDGLLFELAPGQRAQFRIIVQNTGSTLWSRGGDYKLGALGDEAGDAHAFLVGAGGDPNRVWLPEGVEVWPNGTYVFELAVVAPSTPRVYQPRFQMVRDGEGGGWLGAPSPLVSIHVVQPQ